MLPSQSHRKRLWLPLLVASLTAVIAVVAGLAFRTFGNSMDSLTAEDLALMGAIVWTAVAVALLRASGGLRQEPWQAHEGGPEREAANAALRQALERTRRILDGTLDAVVGMDMQGTITDWNARAEAMFGWAREEAIGRKLVETIIPPQYRDAHERGLQRFLTSGEDPFLNRRIELTALRRDGTEFPVELTISPLKMVGSYVFSSFIADITERKKSEEALRDSQERFRKAFDEAPIGMALCATDGHWLQVNRALCQIVGYSEQELLATNFQAITHPDDLEADLTLVRQLLNGEIPSYQMEKRYIHRLGHVVWIQLTGSVVRDVKGAPLYCIAQIQDITERKQGEEALRSTEQRFRSIFNQSPLGIAVLDSTTGRFIRINQTYCDIVGSSMEEMLSRTFHDITHPDDLAADANNMKLLLNGHIDRFRMEKRYLRKDGSIVWVNLTCVRLWGDSTEEVRVHLAMVEDITERKRAENLRERLVAELAESRNRFEMFFRQTPSPIAITTLKEGRFLDLNKRAEVLTGYSREELIGRTTVEMNLYVDPTDRPKLVQALKEKGLLTDVERLIRTKSGEIRTAIFSLVPIQIGSEACLLSIAHDITERRRAEEALRSNEQVLQTLLKEREQLMQDLHDGIIQSLYAIGMSVDECRRLAVEDPGKAGMKLGQTVDDINRVIREVRQHLAQGVDDMPFSASRFKAELTRVAATMERANALHFRLKVDQRAAECLTTDERKEILYVAQETMSNCLRHSGASVANVSLRLGRDRVVLEVEDDGKGFDANALMETTGGLHNIDRRAVKVGAKVEIVSRRDHGTRIRLIVPIQS